MDEQAAAKALNHANALGNRPEKQTLINALMRRDTRAARTQILLMTPTIGLENLPDIAAGADRSDHRLLRELRKLLKM